MATHLGNVIEVGSSTSGASVVFYAHGSESLRTYLGHSKFHSRSDCRALLGGNAKKSVIKEWLVDVPEAAWCKVCRVHS